MTRISDEELVNAMAANVDADGNDVGLDLWVASWTPEQRVRARENVQSWVAAARQALSVDSMLEGELAQDERPSSRT